MSGETGLGAKKCAKPYMANLEKSLGALVSEHATVLGRIRYFHGSMPIGAIGVEP